MNFLEEIAADVSRASLETVGGRPRKHGKGRQRKLVCESCGFLAYCSAGAVARVGAPTCACGAPMVLAHLRDRAKVDEAGTLAELEAMSPRARNAAARSLGWDALCVPLDASEHVAADRRSGGDPKRCEAPGCTRWARTRYCAEHEASRPALTPIHRGRA